MTIVYWENPALSTVCAAVEDNEFGPELVKFGQELTATMNSKNGLGLAAPQVGITKRVFVMLQDYEEEARAVVVCNPTLRLEGNTVVAREGCLSMPNVFEQVARAENVVMQYRDPQGDSHELAFDSMNARITQHEFDHLNGIMFFDYKDKRPAYGARMSKQVSKQVMRTWDKEKRTRGL